MAKNSVTDWDETAANNSDIAGVNIAEDCAPANINNAIRTVMAQLKTFFKASVFRLWDNTDTTKLLAFDLSDITTATTRTVTIPDKNGTMAMTDDVNPATTAKTAAYTVVAGDKNKTILCDASSAAFTVTLPAAATAGGGFEVSVKKTDSSVNAVTIDGNASETIDGATTLVVSQQYDSYTLVCDGSNWHVQSDSDRRRPTLETVQATTSGTNIDFTIPAWATKIIVSLAGVSTNGTSAVMLQIGDAGGIEDTGYGACCTRFGPSTVSTGNTSNGFQVGNDISASDTLHGQLTLSLLDPATNRWSAMGAFSRSNTTGQFLTSGSKALSASLISVRLTTASGDTFDAGSANVQYS